HRLLRADLHLVRAELVEEGDEAGAHGEPPWPQRASPGVRATRSYSPSAADSGTTSAPSYFPSSSVASAPSSTSRPRASLSANATSTWPHGAPSAATSPRTCTGAPRCGSASTTVSAIFDSGRSSRADEEDDGDATLA